LLSLNKPERLKKISGGFGNSKTLLNGTKK